MIKSSAAPGWPLSADAFMSSTVPLPTMPPTAVYLPVPELKVYRCAPLVVAIATLWSPSAIMRGVSVSSNAARLLRGDVSPASRGCVSLLNVPDPSFGSITSIPSRVSATMCIAPVCR